MTPCIVHKQQTDLWTLNKQARLIPLKHLGFSDFNITMGEPLRALTKKQTINAVMPSFDVLPPLHS